MSDGTSVLAWGGVGGGDVGAWRGWEGWWGAMEGMVWGYAGRIQQMVRGERCLGANCCVN